ncbi:MAG: hypothetical protein RLZZ500_2404 [Bacteroidota bacterium]
MRNTTAMTTLKNDNQLVHFSKKFGLITPSQVILMNGSRQEKIDLDSIYTVNLFKKRIFSINMLLFLAGGLFLVVAYFSFVIKDLLLFWSTLAIGSSMVLYSLVQKFHTYRLVILEKNKIVHEVQATQFHRKCIKEFYATIHYKIVKAKRTKKVMAE